MSYIIKRVEGDETTYYHDKDPELGIRFCPLMKEAYIFPGLMFAAQFIRDNKEALKEFGGLIKATEIDDENGECIDIINLEEEVEDVVNHPSHYETGQFECIEVMQEALGYDAVRDFCICNAFKYIYRHKRKNGYEDIKKAQRYINKYVEITEKAAKTGLNPM